MKLNIPLVGIVRSTGYAVDPYLMHRKISRDIGSQHIFLNLLGQGAGLLAKILGRFSRVCNHAFDMFILVNTSQAVKLHASCRHLLHLRIIVQPNRNYTVVRSFFLPYKLSATGCVSMSIG